MFNKIKIVYFKDSYMREYILEFKNLEYKKIMETQKCRVRKIRMTVDSLTNEVVIHLNKINQLLTEVEQTLVIHPKIEENYNMKSNNSPHSY